ncbi:MAG: hypothetical protein ERJ67_11680 [Aphanocapsa feldmannii 277cV]|uniref:DUF3598 family protein n=1 Tax=Aphanocapsa feldmannii 277cV TaxID=2507553 RepID=A0A524RKD5_9CHRO|nr:MAG: hypothetical protein ERJ67_11680 [Aphanocapsa feldmannii 277cV]
MSWSGPIAMLTRSREILLARNGGRWHGTFIRLDATGREETRFFSVLLLEERSGQIEATLVNRISGKTSSMVFSDLPAEMQLDTAGHWSLGPERVGASAWVTELCVVAGDCRRRTVVRHGLDRLESIVYVMEARPGVLQPVLPEPLQVCPQLKRQGPMGLLCFHPEPGVEIATLEGPRPGAAIHCTLRWRQPDGTLLSFARSYGPDGLLSG